MGKPAAVASALLMCSQGLGPSTLMVIPVNRVLVEGRPAATIKDNVPIANIMPFPMCSAIANPTVAAATAAASGVLTPAPCLPVVPAPWVNGAVRTTVGGAPALTAGAQCNCAYGGVIQVANPGTVRTLEG